MTHPRSFDFLRDEASAPHELQTLSVFCGLKSKPMDRNLGSSGVTTVPFLHATDSGVMSRLLLPFLVLFSASAFEVLDVGAPRTGTQSMYDALGILGLNTLHSGYRSDKRIPWCEYLFANGSLQDAMETLQGYDAAMDEPFQLVYEEIH